MINSALAQSNWNLAVPKINISGWGKAQANSTLVFSPFKNWKQCDEESQDPMSPPQETPGYNAVISDS